MSRPGQESLEASAPSAARVGDTRAAGIGRPVVLGADGLHGSGRLWGRVVAAIEAPAAERAMGGGAIGDSFRCGELEMSHFFGRPHLSGGPAYCVLCAPERRGRVVSSLAISPPVAV